MTKREIVEAVLAGRRMDRIPCSFWHHFPPEQATGLGAVRAHARHLEEFDLDFLKVMNDHRYPWAADVVVESAGDLLKIRAYEGHSATFSSQLEVLQMLRRECGNDVFMATTIFGPWTVLRNLTAPPSDRHGPPTLAAGHDPREQRMAALVREDLRGVTAALEIIAAGLADFARKCCLAGADGIFLSVRDDWVQASGADYGTVVEGWDRQVLEAVSSAPFNILHACGVPQSLKRFASYPCAVLHWADRDSGIALSGARALTDKVLCGGVSNLSTLITGGPSDVASEVHDAIRQVGEGRFLVAPGCTYDPQLVPKENLLALVHAARGESVI